MAVRKSYASTLMAMACLVAVTGAWTVVTAARSRAPSCITPYELPAPTCTPQAIIRHDPYCVIDPVCVSPLYVRPTTGGFPSWQGSMTSLPDPSLGGHTS